MELFETFGLRELVIGSAILLGVYSGVIMIRLSRLSGKQAASPDWSKDPSEFGQQMVNRGIEAELDELRGEIAALKQEVSLLRTARHVSPQYGEAMALAQQGLAAQQVAERCGISVAEAEMVCALSRKQTE